MNVRGVRQVFRRVFLARRMRAFLRTFEPTDRTAILDVGGTPYAWELVGWRFPVEFLNVRSPRPRGDGPSIHSFAQGDGTDMAYPDKAYDIVFSNSVIEHLSSFESQRRFAREVRRVGKQLWVQTPARSFLVEPHLVTPFIHYLPKRVQGRLIRNFTIWGLMERPSEDQIATFLREMRLLSYGEMQELFPDCEVRRERMLFFTKSYIAVRR